MIKRNRIYTNEGKKMRGLLKVVLIAIVIIGFPKQVN